MRTRTIAILLAILPISSNAAFLTSTDTIPQTALSEGCYISGMGTVIDESNYGYSTESSNFGLTKSVTQGFETVKSSILNQIKKSNEWQGAIGYKVVVYGGFGGLGTSTLSTSDYKTGDEIFGIGPFVVHGYATPVSITCDKKADK